MRRVVRMPRQLEWRYRARTHPQACTRGHPAVSNSSSSHLLANASRTACVWLPQAVDMVVSFVIASHYGMKVAFLTTVYLPILGALIAVTGMSRRAQVCAAAQA